MADGTYTNDPGNSDVDAVRFMINDKAVPFRLSDAEIEFLLDRNSSPDYAAAEAAETIGGSLSVLADKTVGPLSIKYSAQAKSYLDLAYALRNRAGAKAGGGPIMTQTEGDPIFAVGMHDNYLGSMFSRLI